MKKFISLVLAAAMLFSFAACDTDTPDNPVKPDETVSNTVSTDKAGNKKEDAVIPFDLYLGNYSLSEWDDVNYVTLSTVDVGTLILSDEAVEKYPNLSNTVEQRNEDIKAYADEEFTFLTECAKEDIANGRDTENFGGYTYTTEYYIQRADNVVLSARYDWDTFSGGMHPNYGTNGLNFDPATGEELTLSDVVTDVPAVISLVVEKVKAENSGEYFDSLEETLSEYAEKNFAWTVNYQSITFYFSPYEIASYAAGLITATVYFDEHPELFNAEYTKAPQSYAYAIPEWNDIEVDLDEKDGKTDTLSYGMHESEEGFVDKIMINLNGNEFTFDDVEVFANNAYLVFANGRQYIYFETYGFNDYTQLMIFEVDKSTVRLKDFVANKGFGYVYIYGEGEYNVTTAKAVFNNPESFVLNTRFDFLGTYRGIKTYSIDRKTGLPVTADKAYAVEMYNDFVLTSKTELSVTVLPGEKEEVMPSGTNFRIIRTDGETYVDTVLDDGRECRIYAELDENEYQHYVDGKNEYDVFEEIMYAG